MPTVAQHYNLRRTSALDMSSADGPERSAPVLLMVSGGADSTALLVMACTSKLDIDDGRGMARIARERLHVLHINHHLRGSASNGDEAFVRDLCARYGLPLCVEHASFTDLGGRNLEAAAREVRYAAARRLVRELSQEAGTPRSAARILTAHTASDRTETFFMNAIKGSGPAGLSSIPRRRNIIVRPLIDQTHAELVRYLEIAGQPWREDESNQDTSYLRNFIRHRIVPVALERNGALERTVGAACDILGDEDAFMSQLAATALRSCVRRRGEGIVVLDAGRLAAAEIAIARRMVRGAVKSLDPEIRLEMRHVEGVLACVGAGEGSLTLPGGIDARMEFGTLTFRTSSAREELAAGWLAVPGSIPVSGGFVLRCRVVGISRGADPVALAREVSREGAHLEGRPLAVLVDAEALGYAFRDLERLVGTSQAEMAPGAAAAARHLRIWVDSPQPGDVMCPLGMHGRTKKLSDILGSEHIPVAERGAVPVLRTAPGGSVVWVAGVRLDERFKCTPGTRIAMRLELERVL
ncbi:MAG: tRNA lysidine(34) synthetase TilS [Collinsella sp.]|nr:tRNA lysidine(34) synthetase TilS [Collinsella sp.]